MPSVAACVIRLCLLPHADSAATTASDDPARRRDGRERHIAPREPRPRPDVDLEPRAGARAIALLAREVPVLREVVHELAVVGDVGEVLEDLLAGAADDLGDFHGI